jgi:hypothetical protein
MVLCRDKESTRRQDRGQLLHNNHTCSSRLSRIVNYRKKRKVARGKISENMVFGQRQGPAHHDTANHDSWEAEAPIVERIPLEDVGKHILVRGVGLSALGKLDADTITLAADLSTPHHEGAGGEEDFDSRQAFQKHVKRVSNRLKRKR